MVTVAHQRNVIKKHSAHRARELSKLGFSRELQTKRSNYHSHPSNGGAEGYPVYFRQEVLEYAVTHGVDAAKEQFNLARATIYYWLTRKHPFTKTGNKERRNLIGRDQLLMSIALFMYPTGTARIFANFVAANGGGIYSERAITKRMKELKITNKAASIEAHEAYLPRNLLRAEIFWNTPPRTGIVGIPRRKFLDFDEAGFCLKDCTRRRGWGPTLVRVRDTGHYNRNMTKLNLILAVEPGNPDLPPHVRGSVHKPRKWFRITTRSVDQLLFADFVNQVCSDIERYPVEGDDERVFLWDNLSVHLTELVTATIEDRPSRNAHRFYSIPRPPYQPKWAPVEYTFCQVAMKLAARVDVSWTIDTLRDELHSIVLSLGFEDGGSVNKTFHHCGYKW
jgi:hypothetical protein